VAATRGWAGERIGGKSALVTMLRQGFDWAYGKAVDGVPGLDGAEALAHRYARRHDSTDEAAAAPDPGAKRLRRHPRLSAGCGGFAVLPAALTANLASALYIQARLIAAIAHLRGHDVKSADVRALALACLAGSKAADTMKDTGVRFGTRLARDGAGWVSPV